MESKKPEAAETGEIGQSRRSSISEDKRPSGIPVPSFVLVVTSLPN